MDIEPDYSQISFTPRKNYFGVTDGVEYKYHAISIEDPETEKPIFRFRKSPPTLHEGFVTIEKKIYYVTTEDLLRRIIRKSREISLEEINGTNTTSSTPVVQTIGTIIQHQQQPAIDNATELEIDQVVNATWNEEIRTLLGHSTSQAEEEWFADWEISDNS